MTLLVIRIKYDLYCIIYDTKHGLFFFFVVLVGWPTQLYLSIIYAMFLILFAMGGNVYSLAKCHFHFYIYVACKD